MNLRAFAHSDKIFKHPWNRTDKMRSPESSSRCRVQDIETKQPIGEPMKQMAGPRCIMIIAGEASEDLHGANLVEVMPARKRLGNPGHPGGRRRWHLNFWNIDMADNASMVSAKTDELILKKRHSALGQAGSR